MYFLESDSLDPHYNLALEQYVFDVLAVEWDFFMLWRNDNAIIVGRHQNTAAEINARYVKEHGICVVRRLSGGGAVYHDRGNINFTFIAAAQSGPAFDFGTFCRPVVKALASFGIQAAISGRNDMTIGGAKFSGNAQYRKHNRVMHHGTILYDSDLSVVGNALNVSKDKIASKGLSSVRSRVTNVREHMPVDIPVEDFMNALREAMFHEYGLTACTLTEQDRKAVTALQHSRYETWEWNYGTSPAYTIRKERRIESFGTLEIHMDVDKGIITCLALHGDYFGNGDSAELCASLVGTRLAREELKKALHGVALDEYFHNLTLESFLDLLLE